MKTAVILMNLGGPDKAESIKPFLFNFFMDPAIIRLPKPLCWFVAKMISRKRGKIDENSPYYHLDYKSPLLDNTKVQARALQDQLDKDYKVFISMRYWHPMSDQVARDVKAWGAERIILLPLYPQFSTTTTGSSFIDWQRAAEKHGLGDIPTRKLCCYPLMDGFIKGSADAVKKTYRDVKKQAGKIKAKAPRVLFSAHGLPEKIIEAGDPYQWQCEKTAHAIAEKTGIKELDWQICYQSRIGPLKWIGPSTDEALEQAAKDKAPVIIYPHAFISEHVETLVEIEIEYREVAQGLGIPLFARVETLGNDKAFIDGLAALVSNDDKPCKRICPVDRKACWQGIV